MRSALVVIDVQRGMFMPPSPAYRGEEIVQRITDLLRRARARKVPVIHVQHDGGPGDVLAHGSQGWLLHESVSPAAGEKVVEKRHCSAFQDTALQTELSVARAKRLVIAGLQTEFCVDTTCRAASALGYKVVLASDAHTTFDSSVLSAADIIAHHNKTLGGTFCELVPAHSIEF